RIAGEVGEVELVPAEVPTDSRAAEELPAGIVPLSQDLSLLGFDPDDAAIEDRALTGDRKRLRRRVGLADRRLDPDVAEAGAGHPSAQEPSGGPAADADPLGRPPGLGAAVCGDDLVHDRHRLR